MYPYKEDNVMDRVSFTADGIAARRTSMDISYARPIYDALRRKVSGTEEDKNLSVALASENISLVPFFEARYRILDKLMEEVGVKNILEVAAGLTPRGLIWTLDPETTYVEFDLPKKIRQKKEIFQDLLRDSIITKRPGLHFEGGDAKDEGDFFRATSYFKEDEPIVIVNEGLLGYTHGEKSVYAGKIRRALSRFGGYWITPDVNIVHPMYHDPSLRSYHDRTTASIGMDIAPNLFESVDEAKTFFKNLGFEVEVRSYREVFSELVSPKQLGIPMAKVERLVSEHVAFVMKLK